MCRCAYDAESLVALSYTEPAGQGLITQHMPGAAPRARGLPLAAAEQLAQELRARHSNRSALELHQQVSTLKDHGKEGAGEAGVGRCCMSFVCAHVI